MGLERGYRWITGLLEWLDASVKKEVKSSISVILATCHTIKTSLRK